jgi:hypothetical protein
MGREQQRYMSYLLRLWQAGSGNQDVWRASLQSPHTGEVMGFSTLEALFDFLRLQTGAASDRDDLEESTEGQGERREG